MNFAKLYQNYPKVYPEDIECVFETEQEGEQIGAIYVSNIQAAQNVNTLKKYGIKAVLTAAAGAILNHPKSDIPFYKYVPGEDHQRFDLSKYFDNCADFIRDCLKETNILVHCMAGISRSVTLVLAYLIKYKGMSYAASYAQVKSKRKIIHPNDGFITQLKKYESEQRQIYKSPQKPKKEYQSPYQSPIKKYLKDDSPSKNQSPNKYQTNDIKQNIASPQKKIQSPNKYNNVINLLNTNTIVLDKTEQIDKNDRIISGHSPNSKYNILKAKYSNISPIRNNNKTLYFQQKYTSYNTFDNQPQYLKNRISRVNLSKYLNNNTTTITLTNNQFENKSFVGQNLMNKSNYQIENAEIENKIADIRKKYAEYSEQLKIRPSNMENEKESLTYRPSIGLKHMSSVPYHDQNRKQENYGSPEYSSFRRLTSMLQTSAKYQKKY